MNHPDLFTGAQLRDEEKITDLIHDPRQLTARYEFKSAKYKKLYVSVGTLISEIITYINEKK